MPLPDNLSYGKVVGRYVLAVGDGSDPDSDPDATPVSGTVTFTASASYLLDTTATPPTTIVPQPVVCTFGASGEILDPEGNEGVWLIATDDEDVNPVGWTWRATLQFAGQPTPLRFSFELPAGETVDLTQATPVPSASGTFYVVGPEGPAGPTGPGVLLLGHGASVPNDTPVGTVIFEKAA